MGRVSGKTVLITGSARGQGAVEAEALIREGAFVFVSDVLDDLGRELVERLGDQNAQYLHIDVTNENDWKAAVAVIGERRGSLEVLVNNAGLPHRYGLLETDTESWNRVIAVNLTGPFLGMRETASLMSSGTGSIVNVSSIAGITGHFAAAYSAAKWAIRGLSKTAALEFAPRGIRVNSIHPGIVNTAAVSGDPAFAEAVAGMTPLRRVAEAEEIAPLVLFLASDESSYITGEEIVIDGGFSSLGAYGEAWRRAND